MFELTARCNHRCFFCSCPWEYSVDRPTKELSADEWKQIMRRYKMHGVSHVSFTGGEATLCDYLPMLIEYAYEMGYAITMITNGRAVDDTLLNAVKKCGVLMSVSVPGLETFEEHTGVDNIDNVLSLFEKCRDMGIKTVANIAVTKKNLPELYENISYPILSGAEYVLLNRFLPGGRGMKNTEYMLSNDELNEMLDIAEEVLTRAGVNGHIGTELPYCVVKNPEKYKRLHVGHKCGAAKSFFITDPEGYIKVCNHSPHRVCHWTEIETLDKNEYWQRFRKGDYLPEMCKGCKYLDVCDGGCREAAHVFHGRTNDPDPCFVKDHSPLLYPR
ncbi:MAG: radical SAM protein [Methanimicrococcus sp.]|nr:radical SAM protein [Methanimicrococcus sp.]